jgi:hypothetical protein
MLRGKVVHMSAFTTVATVSSHILRVFFAVDVLAPSYTEFPPLYIALPLKEILKCVSVEEYRLCQCLCLRLVPKHMVCEWKCWMLPEKCCVHFV